MTISSLGPALDHQNLLMMDQRGWGESSPLSCPGLDLTEPATISTCATQLGDRTRFFSTRNAVADIDAVRAALKLPALTVYGYSWGTLLGQAYANRYPDRVRSIALDSALGIDDAAVREHRRIPPLVQLDEPGLVPHSVLPSVEKGSSEPLCVRPIAAGYRSLHFQQDRKVTSVQIVIFISPGNIL
jgi:pimeloyl-ACP methyl ester carboxylesterase